MNKPKTRVENIVVQEMENEILIYDLKINKAFCLNETSAQIWNLCDGKKTVAEISENLNKNLKQPITEDFVWLALDSFKKDNLLEENEQFEIDFKGLNRRQIIKKIGFASLVTLPVIASVIAPQAAQAATCIGLNQPCTGDNSVGNCCAGQGYCFNGTCRFCVPPNFGAFCATNPPNCSALAYRCCNGMTFLTNDPCPIFPGQLICSCSA